MGSSSTMQRSTGQLGTNRLTVPSVRSNTMPCGAHAQRCSILRQWRWVTRSDKNMPSKSSQQSRHFVQRSYVIWAYPWPNHNPLVPRTLWFSNKVCIEHSFGFSCNWSRGSSTDEMGQHSPLHRASAAVQHSTWLSVSVRERIWASRRLVKVVGCIRLIKLSLCDSSPSLEIRIRWINASPWSSHVTKTLKSYQASLHHLQNDRQQDKLDVEKRQNCTLKRHIESTQQK